MTDKRKSKAKGLHGQALKDFNHAKSILRSKGLISKKSKAIGQPSKYMRAKVKALMPVVRNELAPVKRSPKIAREYKAAGFKVVNGRLLLSPDQAASVRRSRNEYLTMERMTAGGTIERRVVLPVGVHNIETFFADEDRINALILPGRQLAFTYYGNKSLQTFPSATALFERLQHYSIVTGKRHEQEQAWDNLVLFDLRDDRAREWKDEARASSEAMQLERARAARKAYRRQRVLKNGRSDIPVRTTPLTQEQVRARELAALQKKRREDTNFVERERERNRERMRAKRGTKKPRK